MLSLFLEGPLVVSTRPESNILRWKETRLIRSKARFAGGK